MVFGTSYAKKGSCLANVELVLFMAPNAETSQI